MSGMQPENRDHPAPEDCEYDLCGPRFLSIKVPELPAEPGVEIESIFYDKLLAMTRSRNIEMKLLVAASVLLLLSLPGLGIGVMFTGR